METYYIELISEGKVVSTEEITTDNYDEVLLIVADYMKMPYQVHFYNAASYLAQKKEKC